MEGCEGPGAEGRTKPAFFYWSNASEWLAQGNTTVPCDHTNAMAPWVDVKGSVGTCADVTIWEGWTVVLDVMTPFLNRLTIRGTLIALHNTNDTIGIHANLIDIQGT